MPKANPHRPHRRACPRKGADAAFAKAMARSEFGRFYTDDNEQREVRRSLASAQARRQGQQEPQAAPAQDRKSENPAKKSKSPVSRGVRVRERRTELAEAFARLRVAGKQRS